MKAVTKGVCSGSFKHISLSSVKDIFDGLAWSASGSSAFRFEIHCSPFFVALPRIPEALISPARFAVCTAPWGR